MSAPFDIRPARIPADFLAAARLFRAYAAALPVDLAYQDFESELAQLPGPYAPPGGELLLARSAEGFAVGCVGLKAMPAAGRCEMKRLFLTPETRGTGLGRTLVETVITTGRSLGYRELMLDTLASMSAAHTLYASLGFRTTEPYYAPTPGGTVFMSLTL